MMLAALITAPRARAAADRGHAGWSAAVVRRAGADRRAGSTSRRGCRGRSPRTSAASDRWPGSRCSRRWRGRWSASLVGHWLGAASRDARRLARGLRHHAASSASAHDRAVTLVRAHRPLHHSLPVGGRAADGAGDVLLSAGTDRAAGAAGVRGDAALAAAAVLGDAASSGRRRCSSTGFTSSWSTACCSSGFTNRLCMGQATVAFVLMTAAMLGLALLRLKYWRGWRHWRGGDGRQICACRNAVAVTCPRRSVLYNS